MAIPYHSHNFEIPVADKADVAAGLAADKAVVPASLGSAAAAEREEFASAAQMAELESAQKKLAEALQKLAEARQLAEEAGQKAEAALQKAQSAGDVRKADLGALAFKNTVPLSALAASGAMTSATALFGDGAWRALPASGGGKGDMAAGLYDPRGIKADAFAMDNMQNGKRNMFLSKQDYDALLQMPGKAAARETRIEAGSGLEGGGDLSANLRLSLSGESRAALQKAQTALQRADCGALAFKNTVAAADIAAGGARNAASFLRGDGQWAEVQAGGTKGEPGPPGKDGISVTAIRII